MPITLTQVERHAPSAGDGTALAAAQRRASRLNLAQIVHRRRLIILLEGFAGSGRKAALRLLAGTLDPCTATVHCGDTLAADGRHWLAPFWERLPRASESAIFHRGWYHALAEERAAGRIDDKSWARGGDEINEFEAQQTDDGTILVKLFFNVAPHVQAQRLRARLEDPWLAAVEGPGDAVRDSDVAAWEALFAQTDTRWAPWRVIDGNDEQAAQAAVLAEVADAIEKSVPSEPPERSLAEQRYA